MALLLGAYRDVSTDQSLVRFVDDNQENVKGFLANKEALLFYEDSASVCLYSSGLAPGQRKRPHTTSTQPLSLRDLKFCFFSFVGTYSPAVAPTTKASTSPILPRQYGTLILCPALIIVTSFMCRYRKTTGKPSGPISG